MSPKRRSHREALTRALARLGGVGYADELEDDAETLSPYRAEADQLISEGFGWRTELSKDADPMLRSLLGMLEGKEAQEQRAIAEEFLARLLHDANTGKIVPDASDPTKYSAMAKAVLDVGFVPGSIPG